MGQAAAAVRGKRAGAAPRHQQAHALEKAEEEVEEVEDLIAWGNTIIDFAGGEEMDEDEEEDDLQPSTTGTVKQWRW